MAPLSAAHKGPPPERDPEKKKRRSSRRKTAEVTTDHERIRKWVEERGGKPATVKGSGGNEPAGILRIDFPGYAGKTELMTITWEAFFTKFDERGLAFLFQEKTAEGELSRFWKLVRRDTTPSEKSSEG